MEEGGEGGGERIIVIIIHGQLHMYSGLKVKPLNCEHFEIRVKVHIYFSHLKDLFFISLTPMMVLLCN